MERQVKERLIGAAVLIAAAVILIPELLSGPKQPATAPAPARAGEAPMKTYTIDLNRSPDVPAAATVEEQAPPPEVPPAENQPAAPAGQLANSSADNSATGEPPSAAVEPPQASAPPTTPTPVPAEAEQAPARSAPEPPASQPATKPESPAVKPSTPVRPNPSTTPAPVVVADRKPLPEPAQPAPIKPLASAAAAPTSKQWAVQLGSFSSKANAERLVKEWEGRGQQGSIAPVRVASGTLYRARLGPFNDREAADATLRKVRASVNGAAIVALP